jgi:hypothetical protein
MSPDSAWRLSREWRQAELIRRDDANSPRQPNPQNGVQNAILGEIERILEIPGLCLRSPKKILT